MTDNWIGVVVMINRFIKAAPKQSRMPQDSGPQTYSILSNFEVMFIFSFREILSISKWGLSCFVNLLEI